jgi:hypothetical protein
VQETKVEEKKIEEKKTVEKKKVEVSKITNYNHKYYTTFNTNIMAFKRISPQLCKFFVNIKFV